MTFLVDTLQRVGFFCMQVIHEGISVEDTNPGIHVAVQYGHPDRGWAGPSTSRRTRLDYLRHKTSRGFQSNKDKHHIYLIREGFGCNQLGLLRRNRLGTRLVTLPAPLHYLKAGRDPLEGNV